MNAPDREIYLRNVSTDQLELWLQSVLGRLRPTDDTPPRGQRNLLANYQGHDVPVFILENTPAKPYSCLWIQSNDVPWPDDVTLARQVCAALQCETRCAVNAWQEGDDEENDEWLVISPQGEKVVQWRG
jgi:hypothetical protein